MQSKWIENDNLENLQDGFFSLDFEWRFIYVNQQAVQTLGKDPKKLIGKIIWEESPSIIGTELEKTYRRAMETQVVQRIEMKGWHTDTWYNIFVYPISEGISIYWHDISNQKLSDEKFDKTDEKYQKLLNSIDQGYYVIDVIFDEYKKPVDMYYVEANEASIRIVGSDYANRYISDINPNYESFWFEIFGQVALTGKNMRMEQYAGPDKKWYSFNIFKIGDGNSRRIGNIFMDITERRQAEEIYRLRLEKEVNERTSELNESKELLNAIIQAQAVSLCVFKAVRDDKGNIIDLEYTFANDLTKQLAYNLNLEAMLYSKVFQNIEESGLLGIFREVIETGKMFKGEVYYSDSILTDWFHLIVVKFGDGIVVNSEVITERKEAELELNRVKEELAQKTTDKYLMLFNSIDEGFCIIEMIFDELENPIDFQIIECNPSLKKLTGLSGVVGKKIRVISPEINEYWIEKFGQVALTGEPIRFEDWDSKKDQCFEFHASRFGDKKSRKVAIVLNSITERKLSEEKARELIEKLRKEDQNKNNFLNILSHELRNPMASIMMSLSLMDNINPSEVQVIRAKEIAKRQLNQLSRLVDDLLEVTRINTNKITLKMQRLELNDLIQKAVSDYQAQFAKKEILLTAELSSIPIYVLADPVRITQVIGNLLHNSAKFTEEGGKTIVRVEMSEIKSEAIIKVIDNGTGIKQELLPAIFNPFIQGDNSIDRSSGGLGLGLAIVKGMVELHSGNVEVFSEGILKGTQFTIRLPLLGEIDDIIENGNGKEKLSSSSLRILIIDDNKDLAEIMCTLIGFLGNKTSSALNGTDGISKAKEFHPDVIICDIGLPDMSGYEVAKKIRNDDEIKGVYLIALSGYAGHEDIERSRQAGFDRHIAKPVDIETLKIVLNEVNTVVK